MLFPSRLFEDAVERAAPDVDAVLVKQL